MSTIVVALTLTMG